MPATPDRHAPKTPAQQEEVTRALRELAHDMFSERRLIIASNRGPVEYQLKEDGALESQRGSGGVVTALTAVSQITDLTWVASAMTEGDRRAAADAKRGSLRLGDEETGIYVRFVVSPPAVYNRYYNTFCNPLLWFIQHY
ncbi:MAG: trehalose-6-phosphate synthase, partial [Dehalococcoidia bacterium]